MIMERHVSMKTTMCMPLKADHSHAWLLFRSQWKVLVYDRKCRDIISPLLNVR
jgi:hypothetical protein